MKGTSPVPTRFSTPHLVHERSESIWEILATQKNMKKKFKSRKKKLRAKESDRGNNKKADGAAVEHRAASLMAL